MPTTVDHPRSATARLRPATAIRTLLAVGLTAVLGLVLTASPAAATQVADLSWIQAMGRTRDCLDVPTGVAAFSDGSRVQVYGCKNAGASDQWNQRWLVDYQPATGTFMIASYYSGLCLQANPSIFGNIEMSHCDSSAAQQSWYLLATPYVATRALAPVPAAYQHPYSLVNRYQYLATGQLFALDIPSTPGSRLQLSAYDRHAKNQAWDGYELQCAYAYNLHFNAVTNACQ
jgi:ricin-type beta-trefoil lectin protein